DSLGCLVNPTVRSSYLELKFGGDSSLKLVSLFCSGKEQWFDENSYFSSSVSLLPIHGCGILAKDGGFLINKGLEIVAKVEVLEVVGKLDVTEETSMLMETMDVNGFQIPSSQVDSVSHMFERHPGI
ncbi:hypothetical protein DY000_02033567, partial [Brassica cretica]